MSGQDASWRSGAIFVGERSQGSVLVGSGGRLSTDLIVGVNAGDIVSSGGTGDVTVVGQGSQLDFFSATIGKAGFRNASHPERRHGVRPELECRGGVGRVR